MRISYARGVRVGELTIDPDGPVPVAFWTHRPPRRAPARQALAARPLADGWAGVLGLPLNQGSVAAGLRVELLPTGYGPGGAAALLSRAGRSTLVVGPTTEALGARAAHQLVLAAPAAPTRAPSNWLATLKSAPEARVVVPDSGAAEVLVASLDAHGVSWSGPAWLGGPRRGGQVHVALSGPGVSLDLRPVPRVSWLVDFARRVGPERVWVHGPASAPLVAGLRAIGLPVSRLDGAEWRPLPSSPPRARRAEARSEAPGDPRG